MSTTTSFPVPSSVSTKHSEKVGKQKSKTRFRLFILAGLSLPCLFHAYKVTSVYFQYPVLDTLRVEYPEQLEFPTVTVCSLNLVHKQYTSCLKMHHKDIKFCPLDFEHDPTRIFQRRIPGPHEIHLPERKFLFDSKGGNVTGSATEFWYDYYETPEKVRMAMSQSDRMFAYNSMSMKGADVIEVRTVFNPRYGGCFSLLLRKDERNRTRTVSRAGPEDGLRFVLVFPSDEFHRQLHVVGGRVFIGDEPPNPEERGFTVSPGMEVSVALEQTRVRKLPAPYKPGCRDYKGSVRSQRECEKACVQRLHLARCGCTDPAMAMSVQKKSCSLINVKKMDCLKKSTEAMGRESCDCPPPCFSSSYRTLLSYAKAPSESFVRKDAFRFHPRLVKEQRDRVVRVKVFYSSLERRTYEQVPAFPVWKLLSCLGGAFGLWVGISLLTLLDVLEKSFAVCSRKIKGSGMSRKTSVSEINTQ